MVRGRFLRNAAIACALAVAAWGQDAGGAEGAEDAGDALDDAVEEAEARLDYDIRTTDRLTGDWCGRRTCFEEHGFLCELSATSYLQGVARGGLQTSDAWSFSGSLDLELTFDLGKMNAIEGGSIYLWATSAWGESPTTRGWVGDAFYVNGAEIGDRPIDIHELWYEQAFLCDTLKVRLGKISLSYSFDVNAYAWDPYTQFLNYGFNNSPNIPFPSNAFGALAIQAFYTPTDSFYAGAAISDSDAEFNETGFSTAFSGPSGYLGIVEFGWTPTFETRRGALPGHYRFGAWYDTTEKEEFYDDMGGAIPDAPLSDDDFGAYLSFDQLVWREKPCDEENEEGLGLFARYSYARGDVNLIEHFWSFGAQYRGLLPCRDDDVVGIAFGQGFLSDESSLSGYPGGSEKAIELYYDVKVFPWLTVAPDFQWILDPSGDDDADAWVLGLRVGVTF